MHEKHWKSEEVEETLSETLECHVKEVKAHEDSLAEVNKELDVSVNYGVNIVHVDFHSGGMFYFDLDIPQESLNLKKVVVDRELVSDDE